MINQMLLPMRYPRVTSYPYHANLLSILPDDDHVKEWLFSNYIQLEMPDQIHNTRMDFSVPSLWKTCPLVYYQRMNRSLIAAGWDSIKDFIIDAIQRENYVYFLTDHSCLSLSPAYNKGRFIHDLFIYGYDPDKDNFYVADFFDQKYVYAVVDAASVIRAYEQVTAEEDWLNGVELVQHRKRIYRFDLKHMIHQLQKYISSSRHTDSIDIPSEHYKHCWLYGVRIYDHLYYYLELLAEGKIHYDIRPFHVLYDHKALMMDRITFLEERGYLKAGRQYAQRASSIENKMLIVRNKMIKLHFINQAAGYLKLIDTLREVKEIEDELIQEILEELKNAETEQDTNLAAMAHIEASSLSLDRHSGPENVVNPNLDLIYASEHSPHFPVYLEFQFEQEMNCNTLIMKSRFSQSLGVTNVDIEVSDDGHSGWVRVAGVSDIAYDYDDYHTEEVIVDLGEVEGKRGIRLRINDANCRWGRFEINEVCLYHKK